MLGAKLIAAKEKKHNIHPLWIFKLFGNFLRAANSVPQPKRARYSSFRALGVRIYYSFFSIRNALCFFLEVLARIEEPRPLRPKSGRSWIRS